MILDITSFLTYCFWDRKVGFIATILGILSSRLLSWIGSAALSGQRHLPKRETLIAARLAQRSSLYIEKLVTNKNTIRYIGFRSASDGGRYFDFSVSATDHGNFLTSLQIPALFFYGAHRIRLQEGVGICYAKLKQRLDGGPLTDVIAELCLTRDDIEQYREGRAGPRPRKNGSEETGINSAPVYDRTIS